jgi:hypothetical protein
MLNNCHALTRRFGFGRLPALVLYLSMSFLAGCSHTRMVTVTVPPRVDLSGYGTIGLMNFTSNADGEINGFATQRLQQAIQAAQPGTRFIELGSTESVLAAVGAKSLDAEAIKRIGQKYEVTAFFHGNVVYSHPKTNVRVLDVTKLQGSVRKELKGDVFAKRVECRTGASVWSSSAWAKRTIGGVSVNGNAVSVTPNEENPQREMIPALVYHLTHDFRATTVQREVSDKAAS